jgi:uncharacterized surface protein with fasciclin (FAS1) repeats
MRSVFASALACLLLPHRAEGGSALRAWGPQLFVCQGGQCVPNSKGLPLSECEAVCIAPVPPTNYTCTKNECVPTDGGLPGLPKAQCADVCGEKNILGLINSRSDLSALYAAVNSTALKAEWALRAPLTVFAPNNAAFAALPPATLQRLLDPANVKLLAAVLQYHVHAGVPTGPGTESSKALHTDNFTDHQLIKTCEGESVEITLPADGTIYVDRGRVIDPDRSASNGVIHVIDHVLMPLEPPGNHLYFRDIDSQGFCGEVDAGPRMPDGIFKNKTVLQEYIDVTLAFDWAGHLELGLCSEAGYAVPAPCPFKQPIQWAPPALMRPVCEERCGCDFPCPKAHDGPHQHFCSLCGPKFNAPISIQCYRHDL